MTSLASHPGLPAHLPSYSLPPAPALSSEDLLTHSLPLTTSLLGLLGELAYHKAEHETAFAHLRKSVEIDDNLPYDEPWGWMQPTRHALGALLLEQGKADEAEAVYRADLGLDDTLSRACQHPANVWSLHGLH